MTIKKWILISLVAVVLIVVGGAAAIFTYLKTEAEENGGKVIMTVGAAYAKYWSYEKASAFLEKIISEQKGEDPVAMAKLTYMLINIEGIGKEKNYDEALKLIYEIMSGGVYSIFSPERIVELRTAVEQQEGFDFDAFFSHPFAKFVEESANAGNPKALYVMAWAESVLKDNREKARAYLEQAAEKGLARAQNELAYHYFYLKPPQHELAMKWFCAAAEQDLIEAQFRCGILHESPKISSPDKSLAYFWHRRAMDHETIDQNSEFFLENTIELRKAKEEKRMEKMQKRMTPEEIERGQNLFSEWKRTHAVQSVQ